MKCPKIYNARAELLFSSVNLLFGDVLVAFTIVVCLGLLKLPIKSHGVVVNVSITLTSTQCSFSNRSTLPHILEREFPFSCVPFCFAFIWVNCLWHVQLRVIFVILFQATSPDRSVWRRAGHVVNHCRVTQ